MRVISTILILSTALVSFALFGNSNSDFNRASNLLECRGCSAQSKKDSLLSLSGQWNELSNKNIIEITKKMRNEYNKDVIPKKYVFEALEGINYAVLDSSSQLFTDLLTILSGIGEWQTVIKILTKHPILSRKIDNFFACEQQEDFSVIKRILAEKSRIEQEKNTKKLMDTIKSEGLDLQTVDYYVDHLGVDITYTDSKGNNLISYIMKYCDDEKFKTDKIKPLVDKLFEKYPEGIAVALLNPNYAKKSTTSHAIENGNFKIYDVFMQRRKQHEYLKWIYSEDYFEQKWAIRALKDRQKSKKFRSILKQFNEKII